MENKKAKIENSLKKVEKWVEEHEYKGYEPFDGLSSYLRPLTFGNLFLDRILLQLVRQSPINLRPLLGVKPLDSTIGQGYMAWGYLKMLKLTGDQSYKTKAEQCLDWLDKNKSFGYQYHSWGKHFDFASRGGRYPAFEPITIWTSLIGMAYLEAYEVLGAQKYLDISVSICNWIMALPRNYTDRGFCLNYTGSNDEVCTIHNHSMMGAAMLAKTAKHTGNEEYFKVARDAMTFSITRQLSDGAWYYGEELNQHWIDNFHTGYNLDALKIYIESTGDKTLEDNAKRGLQFYINNFFEPTGRPKYYHSRTYPVDSQCASQAIDTLANFSAYDTSSLNVALKVACWWIDNMQDKEGYFYYRQYPGGIKAKTPMLHWAEATTYKALAVLYSKLK